MLPASFSLSPNKAFELLANFYQILWSDKGHRIKVHAKYDNSDWREEKRKMQLVKANELILLDLRESTWESVTEERRGNNNLSFSV